GAAAAATAALPASGSNGVRAVAAQ
ncbi:glucokinase, partial [Streptomyces sp. DpondAA-F4a]